RMSRFETLDEMLAAEDDLDRPSFFEDRERVRCPSAIRVRHEPFGASEQFRDPGFRRFFQRLKVSLNARRFDWRIASEIEFDAGFLQAPPRKTPAVELIADLVFQPRPVAQPMAGLEVASDVETRHERQRIGSDNFRMLEMETSANVLFLQFARESDDF